MPPADFVVWIIKKRNGITDFLPAAILLCAVAAGLLWGSCTKYFALIAAAPVLWTLAPSRLIAGLVMLVYYLAGSRGLVFGAAEFAGAGGQPNIAAGFFVWSATAVVLSLPWTFLWHKTKELAEKDTLSCVKAIIAETGRILLIQAMLILPPVGLIGWANPLTATGYFFPKTGILGMFLLCILWGCWHLYPLLSGRSKHFLTGLSAAMLLFALFVSPFRYVCNPYSVKGYATHFGRLFSGSGSSDASSAYMRCLLVKNILAEEKEKPLAAVFPETVAGPWFSITDNFFKTRVIPEFEKTGRVLLIGTEEQEGTQGYYNEIRIFGAETGCYRQRVPVPCFAWHPWKPNQGNSIGNLFGSGIRYVLNRRCAMLICYEAYIILPVLLSALHKPELIICCSNSWWCKADNLVIVSEQCLKAWSLLFGIPYVSARNS